MILKLYSLNLNHYMHQFSQYNISCIFITNIPEAIYCATLEGEKLLSSANIVYEKQKNILLSSTFLINHPLENVLSCTFLK